MKPSRFIESCRKYCGRPVRRYQQRRAVARSCCLAFVAGAIATLTLAMPVSAAETEQTTAEKNPADQNADDRTIVELSVFPEKLELQDIRDARRLLVSGKDAQGRSYDLSADAKLTPESELIVVVDKDRFVTPQAQGQTQVTIQAAGLTAAVPVVVKDAQKRPVGFVREIVPVISKVGCNQGTCHGAQQGKAGFKLSLRGYDPLYDYRALVDDLSGRRFNRSQPSQSLMLLKPTQGVPHEGGFLFDETSRYYQLFEQWIAEGCRYTEAAPIEHIEIYPTKPLLQRASDQQQLIVLAYYTDGVVRDVTREAVFETSNFEVATVDKGGLIRGVRRGEAAALVRFEGRYAAALVTILGDRDDYEWVPSPEYNFVDTLVNRKLQRVKLLPSELCTDAEFLRRIRLDLVGLPPTAEEVREFLADPADSRTKREAKIDELLASPGYVDHWTLKWSDLLLSNRKALTEKGVWAFRNWIRNGIATNKPYDQFVHELMTASGSTFENPAANYYRVAREPKAVMENMTQVFLGTRFSCNQCHDHPFERWTQQQYYQLSAFFAGVGHKNGPEKDEEIIYSLRTAEPVMHPTTNEPVAAEFPFTYEGADASEADLRERLAHWLTSGDNPYFARSLTNRYWSYFLGRGIIDPVDDIRASNPPSNPELLDALTADFTGNNFDLKHLIRTIVTSHTYQRSFRSNAWNVDDNSNFSHATPRRLGAEELFDAIMVATGAPTNLPGVPAGFRATQLPDPNVNVSFLDMFGRAPRDSPCECERTSDVSLSQTMNLVNGPTVADAIIHPQGRINRLIEQKVDTKELVDEIYLAAICRLPTPEEAEQANAYVGEVGNPAEAAQDLMWALINSPAFLFNR